MLVDLSPAELAEYHLSWQPAKMIFPDCPDDSQILVYDGVPVSGIYLEDLDLAFQDGASSDDITLLLHEMIDELEAEKASAERWRAAHPIKYRGHRIGNRLYYLAHRLIMWGADDPEWGQDPWGGDVDQGRGIDHGMAWSKWSA
jgi:hypothetical protein